MSLAVGRMPRRRGRHATLGLLVDWLEDDYQNAVLSGIEEAAQEHSLNILCFAGGILEAPGRNGLARNHVYELVASHNCDGLLLMSGTLANHVGLEGLVRFRERFEQIPVCSIALPLPATPSVLVDNAAGMRAALVHLIQTHAYRRIAFIRGPMANQEAERRYAVYVDVLGQAGLELDPSLVTVGDFQPDGGVRGVHQLYGERKLRPDAIVTANDGMALGALSALEALNLRVPEDVALVGFDDVEDARFTTPPLTTVRQPLREQGKQAVRLLLGLQQATAAETLTLQTQLVVRRSCGCYSQESAVAMAPSAAATPLSFEASVVRRRDVILAALLRASRGTLGVLGHNWHERLLNALVADVRGDAGAPFLVALDKELDKALGTDTDLSALQGVITALRRELLPCTLGQPELRNRAEDVFQQARLITAEALERCQAQQRLRAERQARTLGTTAAALVSAFDVAALRDTVSRHFPGLGIQSCFVSRYDTAHPPRLARLLLHYDGRDLAPAPSQSEHPFPAPDLVPGSLGSFDRRYTYVVEPLFFQDEAIGFALLEFGPRQGLVYESLREQFSAALKGAALVEQLAACEQDRERLQSLLASQAAAPNGSSG